MITMRYLSFLIILLAAASCNQPGKNFQGTQSAAIRGVIEAVNKKDAAAYVENFADSVKVYVEGTLRVNGKAALMANRSSHFETHSDVRSEIQYLLEIDNKVIMHDKVWLAPGEDGRDIVEIFTFDNGQVVRVDVTQPRDLFK